MRIETFQEYLARGGKVTKVPTVKLEDKSPTVRSTVAKLPTIMHLSEAGIINIASKEKASKKVNLDLIDESLRKKLNL